MSIDIKAYQREQAKITRQQLVDIAINPQNYKHIKLRAEITASYLYNVCAPKPKILEVGCRAGHVLLQLAPMLEKGMGEKAKGFFDSDLFYGVDICEDAVWLAQQAGIHAFVCDMHDLCFDDASFDVVISNETLEHAYDPERVIAEMARILKINGHLVLDVPCQRKEHYAIKENDAGHLQFFPEPFDFYMKFNKDFVARDKYFLPGIWKKFPLLVVRAYGGLWMKKGKG